MKTSPSHLLNCFRVMFSCKTVLLNITYVFVSAKELKKRGFKFFKLLVFFSFVGDQTKTSARPSLGGDF